MAKAKLFLTVVFGSAIAGCGGSPDDASSFGSESESLTGVCATPQNLREDPELLAAGAELVFKIEETTNQSCGAPMGLDEALLLAGRKHGAGER